MFLRVERQNAINLFYRDIQFLGDVLRLKAVTVKSDNRCCARLLWLRAADLYRFSEHPLNAPLYQFHFLPCRFPTRARPVRFAHYLTECGQLVFPFRCFRSCDDNAACSDERQGPLVGRLPIHSEFGNQRAPEGVGVLLEAILPSQLFKPHERLAFGRDQGFVTLHSRKSFSD